jgi:hypothetical protein
MLRTIGSVVLGYLAMAFTVFAGLTAAYVAMGADRAFGPGVYAVSLMWIVVSILVGLTAAFLGGMVARAVSKSVTGPRALAVVVVILGLLLILPVIFGDPPVTAVRTGEIGPMDAMSVAETPLWIMLLNPLIGAIGVLLGGRAFGTTVDRVTIQA